MTARLWGVPGEGLREKTQGRAETMQGVLVAGG
jgi:hypothetical protein